jgi:hypothetical protein
VALIEAACRFAAERGAHCLKAYPVEPKKDPMPPAFAWTGIASAFFEAGFEEVRPIVRRELCSPVRLTPRPDRIRRGCDRSP